MRITDDIRSEEFHRMVDNLEAAIERLEACKEWKEFHYKAQQFAGLNYDHERRQDLLYALRGEIDQYI